MHGSPTSPDMARLSASLTAANYVSTIIAGTDQTDAASLTASLTAANYEQVITNGSATTPEQTSLTASLTEANYELA
jgi:hypothetical protein